MNITIRDRGVSLRERLQPLLARAADLRCSEHDQGVVAVHIDGRENGWFDSRWTTCCDALATRATAIVSNRC